MYRYELPRNKALKGKKFCFYFNKKFKNSFKNLLTTF